WPRPHPRARPPRLPYTTLFRSRHLEPAREVTLGVDELVPRGVRGHRDRTGVRDGHGDPVHADRPLDPELFNELDHGGGEPIPLEDRKSTRLNSSHVKISYAGFC